MSLFSPLILKQVTAKQKQFVYLYQIMYKPLLLLSLFFSLSGHALADGIKLMSWNVYFDDASGDERYPAIIQSIVEQNPDLVCLQEATSKFIGLLKSSEQLANYSPVHSRGASRYKNIILTKTGINSSGIIPLPTNMGRSATYIKTRINNRDTTIVNLHLDSMMNDTALRLRQLEKVVEFTSREDAVILCGDLNFGDGEKENAFIRQHFRDVGLDNPKATYDIENNALAGKTKFLLENSRRLDHILVSDDIKARNYRVLSLPYSDHYPITAELVP